jgi:phosphatidylglycerol:prolipoprotein diacylglycerol transferase
MSFAIPYADLPEIVLVRAGGLWASSPPLSLKPFAILVASGVYLGALCATRYGQRRGIPARVLASFIVYVVSFGFVLGHVLDLVFYSPERLATDPYAVLRLWAGLSSFGGFVGGAAGALLWRRRYGVPVLPYADVVASALPLGWVFGRAGCAVVHDHPGVASAAWFAVAYPGGSRLDLGLLELILTLPIAVVFLLMQRRAWPWGFFLGALCAVYAPLRFALDFLRIRETVLLTSPELLAERRYGELTPAQWACLALGAFGVMLLRRSLSLSDEEAAFAPPKPPRAFALTAPASSSRASESKAKLNRRRDDARHER